MRNEHLPAIWFQHEQDPLEHFAHGQLLRQHTIQALARMVHCGKKKNWEEKKMSLCF